MALTSSTCKKLICVLCLAVGALSIAQARNADEALFMAAEFNDAKAVVAAISGGANPNAVNAKGHSPLLFAITEGSKEAALALIRSSQVDVDKPNLAKETPLMMAAFTGQLDLVKALVEEREVEVNRHGWAPLHYAASNGHTEIAAYLLEHSAYIDVESPNGTTPLMMAAWHGHIQTVKLLLDEGADMMLRNQKGMTVIDFAEQGNYKEIADGLRSRRRKLFPSKGWD